LDKGAGFSERNPLGEISAFFSLGKTRFLGVVPFHLEAYGIAVGLGVTFFFHVFFR